MAYTAISLCSGVEGLGLGVKTALRDLAVRCYVEREAYAIATLDQRMSDGWIDVAPIWNDVCTFDGKPWCGKVDIIFGGYPCQPFSAAGKRKGTDDDRWIWGDIARIINEVKPSLCFFENVFGHIKNGLELVKDDLERMGYKVACGVFSAEEVSAPHERKRLFIMAHHTSIRVERGVLVGCDLRGQKESQDVEEDTGPSTATHELADPNGKAGRDGRDSAAQGLSETQIGQTGKDDHKRQHLRAESGRTIGIMGNATSIGKAPAMPGRDSTGQPQATIGDWGGHIFPPRPNGDWSKVADALKPEVLRGIDGDAYWVGELAAIGNGVVPLSAADAFITLASSFTGK